MRTNIIFVDFESVQPEEVERTVCSLFHIHVFQVLLQRILPMNALRGPRIMRGAGRYCSRAICHQLSSSPRNG